MKESYRKKPEDIEYKQTIPTNILIIKTILYYATKPYFLIKSMSYDIIAQIYYMTLALLELFLNKHRVRLEDPGGIKTTQIEKYKLYYLSINTFSLNVFSIYVGSFISYFIMIENVHCSACENLALLSLGMLFSVMIGMFFYKIHNFLKKQ